jgi:hypothetical protein
MKTAHRDLQTVAAASTPMQKVEMEKVIRQMDAGQVREVAE